MWSSLLLLSLDAVCIPTIWVGVLWIRYCNEMVARKNTLYYSENLQFIEVDICSADLKSFDLLIFCDIFFSSLVSRRWCFPPKSLNYYTCNYWQLSISSCRSLKIPTWQLVLFDWSIFSVHHFIIPRMLFWRILCIAS